MTQVQEHFSEIASAYRVARTTDLEPIRFIIDQLGSTCGIVAADVGCGAGRYDELLLRLLGQELSLRCVDVSAAMLGELDTYLTDLGFRNFETHEADADDLPFATDSLDCIFSFNACHHFNLPGFFTEAHRTLKPGGRLFMYTRTPAQNARSVWGVHFPSFSEKETRLYTVDHVAGVVSRTRGMELTDLKVFRYDRAEGLDRLVDLARTRHYSTFRLYGDLEFEAALDRFARNVEASQEDAEPVRWRDENIMYVITRIRVRRPELEGRASAPPDADGKPIMILTEEDFRTHRKSWRIRPALYREEEPRAKFPANWRVECDYRTALEALPTKVRRAIDRAAKALAGGTRDPTPDSIMTAAGLDLSQHAYGWLVTLGSYHYGKRVPGSRAADPTKRLYGAPTAPPEPRQPHRDPYPSTEPPPDEDSGPLIRRLGLPGR
jgi:SAM-dependent methyltransferase